MHPSEYSARSSNSAGDSPNVDGTTLVSYPAGVTGGLPSSATNSQRNDLPTFRPTGNTPNVADTLSSCMASVRAHLQTAGFSSEVCKILLASWRTSTQKRYEGPWQLWACWCLQQNKCPFSAPVTDVLAFLTEQFTTRKLAYKTMGVYKACISQMHNPVDRLQLGSLPVVSRFMKGLFQL
jgi:hypothetical protein